MTLNDQPENILIDYDVVDNDVTNFEIVVGDWGSARIGNDGGLFFGGTPVYAGPRTFDLNEKDFFSFGRLAMELMLNKPGTELKFRIFKFFFDIFESE